MLGIFEGHLLFPKLTSAVGCTTCFVCFLSFCLSPGSLQSPRPRIPVSMGEAERPDCRGDRAHSSGSLHLGDLVIVKGRKGKTEQNKKRWGMTTELRQRSSGNGSLVSQLSEAQLLPTRKHHPRPGRRSGAGAARALTMTVAAAAAAWAATAAWLAWCCAALILACKCAGG